MRFGRSSVRTLLACLCLLMFRAPARQVSYTKDGAPPQSSVNEARKTLGMLIDASNFARYGFSHPKEIEGARMGTPMHRFIIRPDKIRTYRAGVDPASLLEDSGQWIYPVEVKGDVRCAVTLAGGSSGHWKPISIGQPGLARALFMARAKESKSLKPPDDSRFFVLDVLSTQTTLLVYRTDGNPPDRQPGFERLTCVWIVKPPVDVPVRQGAESLFPYLSRIALDAKASAPRR